MKFSTVLFVVFTAIVFGLPLAQAKVVYVNASAGAGGNGTSWPAACRYLQDALAQTVAGDEVWAAAGTYFPDDGTAITTGDRTATFTLKQDVKLYGGFLGGETALVQRNPETNVTLLSGEIWTEKIQWSLHIVTLVGSATLDGVTVAKSNANGATAPLNQGGGVLVTGSSRSLVVNRCVFTYNIASTGGAIYSASAVTAKDCIFSDNSASSGGAIYSGSASSVTATNCKFSGNSAYWGGGAIFSSSVAATNCTFSDSPTFPGSGWAIHSSGSLIIVTVMNCTFAGNPASSRGAIYSSSTNASSVTATNCNFSGNSAPSSGGAIYSFSTSSTSKVTATNCTFSGNTAGDSGGAIYSSAVTATNCTFSGNTAGDSGGAMWGAVTATNCTFSGNSAWFGGAMSGSVTAMGCRFFGNSASCGGAIYSSLVSAGNCTFSDNSASFSGGAIYSSTANSFSVTTANCIFSNNSADSSGGAIYSSSTSTTKASSVTATNCEFSGNSAPSSGGAIYFSSPFFSRVTATNCTFSGNSASSSSSLNTSSGGAIYSQLLTATNCTFSKNSAVFGGAISSNSANATNCTFTNNSASTSGGAINSYSLTATNCTLINNLARGAGKKGGSIYVVGAAQLFNNVLWHTLAEVQDNLIYVTSGGSITNADFAIPSPLNQAKNLIRGGMAGITAETGAVVSLGDTAVKILSGDPLFSDATNPVGPDGIWRTADDGLRLQASSPALDVGLSMFLAVDIYDLDKDGNLTELLPVDVAGYDRIQGAALDLGSYEAGNSFQPVAILTQPASTTQSRGLVAKFTVTAAGYDLRFQWYLGSSGDVSQPITGATTSSYTTPELFVTSNYWVNVSNLREFVHSQTATLYAESTLLFTTGGNAVWFSQSAATHDGVSAVQSGVITHSQSTSLQTSVENAGTLSFWWQVSSQRSGDYLRFYIDGLEQSGSISGTSGTWIQRTFTVNSPGSHTFEWTYTKNASTSSGSDCGWVDQVGWQPAAITTTFQTWASGYNLTGNNALMTANPSGDGINNLLKYALGLNPNVPTLAATDGTIPGMPLIEKSGTALKFTFIRDTAKSDVTYTVESSTALGIWAPVTANVAETPLAGTLVRVVVTIPGNGQLFCRLRVVK